MKRLLMAAAIVVGSAATALAAAPSAGPLAGLDTLEAGYARHTREHRMWEIERNLEMQRRDRRRDYGRRGYYDDDGYGYRRGYEGRRYGGPRYYERY